MWQMLTNEDGQHSWDQVTGWRQISELLNLHSNRLRTAREQLAASWPARGSGAAGVFLAFVDQFLGSMDGTSTVAAANSAALAGITTSLGKAREAMEQLHNQWQRYAEAEQQNKRPMIRGASPGVLEPRPPQNWRQDLNQQGATIMTAMENEVLDYAQSTTAPAVYVARPHVAAVLPEPDPTPRTQTTAMGRPSLDSYPSVPSPTGASVGAGESPALVPSGVGVGLAGAISKDADSSAEKMLDQPTTPTSASRVGNSVGPIGGILGYPQAITRQPQVDQAPSQSRLDKPEPDLDGRRPSGNNDTFEQGSSPLRQAPSTAAAIC